MMDNKILNYLTPVLLAVVIILQLVSMGGQSQIAVGGTTNYDSLELRPVSSSDSALTVKNSGGTNMFVVDGSGDSTISGTSTVSGPITFSAEAQFAGVIIGGSTATLATSSAISLTAAQVCDNSVLIYNDETDADFASTTLPSATLLFADCLGSDGKSKAVLFKNATSTVTATTTIKVNTASTTLVGVAATDDDLEGSQWALLNFVRVSATELFVSIVKVINAD